MKTEVLPRSESVRRKTAKKDHRQIENSEVGRTVMESLAHVVGSRFEVVKVEVDFRLQAKEAKSVAVAGNFNGWNAGAMPLRKEGDCWVGKLALSRGRYEYRFVVDGIWMNDPNAAEVVANGFGSTNSVLSV